MNRIILCLVLFPFLVNAQTSVNMTTLANYDIPNLPVRFGSKYNDCWGWKHPTNGTEIAVIGGIEAIFFFNVTSPANPVLIYTHPVTNNGGSVNQSLWRDFKTYQNFLYASADEGTSGLLIFDLSNAPTSITLVKQTIDFWTRAHNIYIDEANARLYAAGPNTQQQGMIILGLANPGNPVLLKNLNLSTYEGGYVHDVHVRDNIAYCSHGSLHKLSIYNLNNLNNISIVGAVDEYPGAGYNHSSWLDASGTKLVMADETHGSPLKLVDISDPMNISAGDIKTFKSELEGPAAPSASVAHNPFILGDLAYIAYYHEGVQVFDISDPNNIDTVAYIDTYPNTSYEGYEGVWGVYPYLPSGVIIASDQSTGLYVLQITNTTLDIEFLNFNAKRNTNGVQLNWSVADASFGNKFEVMRSSDGGKTFSSVGKVKLVDHEANYSFLDKTAVSQYKYLYRIDFIELDGKIISSPIRNIFAQEGKHTVRFINPVSNIIIMDVFEPVDMMDVEVYDLEGKLFRAYHLDQPQARVELQTNGLIPGHYMVIAKWTGGSENALLQIID